MSKKSIQIVKENEGHWSVWNPNNCKCADIIRFEDRFPLLGEIKKRYRVDIGSKTIATMLDNFQTAKGIAYNYVKGN